MAYDPLYKSQNSSSETLNASHPPFYPPYDPPYPSFRPASPTPSEKEELNAPLLPKGWYKQKKYWPAIAISAVVLIATILFTILHSQIANALLPAAQWIKSKGFVGALIPIAILVILSFPPLFGGEIIGLLCGDVYGLWVGFAVVVAGTILGECANFVVFKYWCTARAREYENKNLFLAALSKAIAEGGFTMAAMVRYSIIPGHLTTAIFSTCGMSFFTFLAAAVVSAPKQLGEVALGALLQGSDPNAPVSSNSRLLSIVILVITVLMTVISLRYIRKRLATQKLAIIRERRARVSSY